MILNLENYIRSFEIFGMRHFSETRGVLAEEKNRRWHDHTS